MLLLIFLVTSGLQIKQKTPSRFQRRCYMQISDANYFSAFSFTIARTFKDRPNRLMKPSASW